jgi:hypothetical protein
MKIRRMNTKDRVVSVRFNEEEYAVLERKCNDLHMSMSEYIRLKIFQPDNIEWMEFKARLRRWLVEEE